MTTKLALGALALALLPDLGRGDVTLINLFDVPTGQEQATIRAWEAARDFLQTQPGYVSTALHAALNDQTRYQLVNIAIWESPESFQQATAAMQAAGVFPGIEGLRYHPGLYRQIRGD